MRTLLQAGNGAAERMRGSSMCIAGSERRDRKKPPGWGGLETNVRKQGNIMIPEENL